jgi:hypothetical protein
MTQNALVAWPRLRQIGGAALHVSERRQGRIPIRERVEPAASLVRLASPRRVDRFFGRFEKRLEVCRDQILVEERDRVVAGVALGADEPRGRRDRQPLGGEQFAHTRVVGHLREGPRVGPAAAAPARPAVVGGLVRVVEADRSVADDEHERREAITNPDVFEDAADDVRHLAYGESRILSDGRRVVLAIELQSRLRGRHRRLLHADPSR